jgi:hypothetical protein
MCEYGGPFRGRGFEDRALAGDKTARKPGHAALDVLEPFHDHRNIFNFGDHRRPAHDGLIRSPLPAKKGRPQSRRMA